MILHDIIHVQQDFQSMPTDKSAFLAIKNLLLNLLLSEFRHLIPWHTEILLQNFTFRNNELKLLLHLKNMLIFIT